MYEGNKANTIHENTGKTLKLPSSLNQIGRFRDATADRLDARNCCGIR